MTFWEETANAEVDERRTVPMGDISQRIGLILRVIGEPPIGRGSDIAGSEIGEQRILTGAAVAMALVTSRLGSEQVITCLLLRRELRFMGEHGIELRGKARDLGRSLILSDGLRHLIECHRRSSAVELAEVDRPRIVGGPPGRAQTCSTSRGQSIAKACLPQTCSNSVRYGRCEARWTAQAISGKPISTGLVGGPSACSAAGLPNRRPVARISQKLPPTKSP